MVFDLRAGGEQDGRRRRGAVGGELLDYPWGKLYDLVPCAQVPDPTERHLRGPSLRYSSENLVGRSEGGRRKYGKNQEISGPP